MFHVSSLWLCLQLAVAAPVAPPWAPAEVVLTPMLDGAVELAPLHGSPEVAYAACRARWRRLGPALCSVLVPRARAAQRQPGQAELEWRLLGLLGEGVAEATGRLAWAAWVGLRGAAGAALCRLDAIADAAAPRDPADAGPWRRALDRPLVRVVDGLAAVLGAFDSGRPGPYLGRHGVHPGSTLARELPCPAACAAAVGND